MGDIISAVPGIKPVMVKTPEGKQVEDKRKIISIPFEGSDKCAFRVYDDNDNQILFKSSRLGQIERVQGGVEISYHEDINLNDLRFELKDLENGSVVEGIISSENVPEDMQ